MSDVNIQIKQRNGEIWDNLYPKTKAENVVETSTKRFVSDVEMIGKQDSLGYIPENVANKGEVNGYAELDATGKVPSAQLPSYVDDVLEYASQAGFPSTGETGKIFVALDTNITYRWSGSDYVEISASLALGETSATAYRGDRGKTAYDHSQTAHAPSGAEVNQNAFSSVAVSGQTTIVADTKTDTLTVVAGTGISITTDEGADSITITAQGGQTPADHAIEHITGGTDVIADAVASGNSGLMSGSDKAKLDGVAANANNYTHPTTAGNKHVPTGGATGNILVYGGASGTASWTTLTPSDIGAAKITLNESEPSTPASGDFWYEIV